MLYLSQHLSDVVGDVEMMAEAIQYVNLPDSPDRKQRFADLIYVTQASGVTLKRLCKRYI